MRLIDADALMKECAKFVAPSNNSDFAEEPTWNDAISLIGSAPTIEERKTGKWVQTEELWTDMYTAEEQGIYECSCCGEKVIGKPDWRFCPNCGARMEDEP